MRGFTSFFTLLLAVPYSLTAPTGNSQLLPHGMPNPNQTQLMKIQQQAHGTLPGLRLPETISDAGVTNLQLIAFNELFEVAFFNRLLYNVTNNLVGYQFTSEADRQLVIDILSAILGQEEVHALTANNGLQHFNQNQIQPCQYVFPVSTFKSAISLAATFTDMVIGALGDITESFAANGDSALTRVIAATIANEGEQEGWFRSFLDRIPSEVPTLTTSDVNFAFSAVQRFIVPGSCPSIGEIKLDTFPPLEILTPPGAKTQKIKLSWRHDEREMDRIIWLAYVNQLNAPIVVPLKVMSCDGQQVTGEATFPYERYSMNGLTIVAVVESSGPFADIAAVARATLFGPGLIIVN